MVNYKIMEVLGKARHFILTGLLMHLDFNEINVIDQRIIKGLFKAGGCCLDSISQIFHGIVKSSFEILPGFITAVFELN